MTVNTEELLPLPDKPKKDDGTPMRPQGPTHHETEPADSGNTTSGNGDGGAHTDGPTHHETPKL